jgi:hypothetical protein
VLESNDPGPGWRTIMSRLKLSGRERSLERLRRYSAIVTKMATRTKDPMTAPAMMPVLLFLDDTAAAVVGCESLPLVAWAVGLVPLLRTETL